MKTVQERFEMTISNSDFLAERTAMRDLDAPSRALINGPTSADDVAVDGALISYVPLWADSDKDIADWAENGRGTFIRGPDAVASFLKRRDMDLVESAVRGRPFTVGYGITSYPFGECSSESLLRVAQLVVKEPWRVIEVNQA